MISLYGIDYKKKKLIYIIEGKKIAFDYKNKPNIELRYKVSWFKTAYADSIKYFSTKYDHFKIKEKKFVNFLKKNETDFFFNNGKPKCNKALEEQVKKYLIKLGMETDRDQIH